MLPASVRLRARADFAATVREGRRGRSGLLLAYLAPAAGDGDHSNARPRVGFIVSRAVGPAVVRNQVKRRLRALVMARLAVLPRGSRLVVRALPAAASASSAQLGAGLDQALRRLVEGSR